MKIKKNPKQNLDNYSHTFTLLGLVLALFITYTFIEHKSYAATTPPTVVNTKPKQIEEPKTIVYTIEKKKPKPIPKEPTITKKPIKKTVKPIIDSNKFKKAENKTDVIEQNSDENTDNQINLKDIQYYHDPEEYQPETIPSAIIENMPVYPGCEKYMYDREKSEKCFNKNIAKFFAKNFDTNLASKLGITGLQKINCQFIINANGDISPDIKTSKTHVELAKEIKNIISKLPKMKPAKQNGKAVNLIYALPIKFLIE